MCGPLPATTWAEVVVGALNNSIAVREMSPTATAVEYRVIRWMADLAGLGPRAGGTFIQISSEASALMPLSAFGIGVTIA